MESIAPVIRNFHDLRRLKYITVIAHHGSLSAASKALNISQPALSYHLSEVEKNIGTALFLRKAAGMEPTLAGLEFLRHSEAVLTCADQAGEALYRYLHPPVGQPALRIAILPSFASAFAPAIAELLSHEGLNYRLHFIEARAREADVLFENGDIDIALQLVLEAHPDSETLAIENLCMVVRGGPSDEISFQEVCATPLILPSYGNTIRPLLEKQAELCGFSLNVAMEIDGFDPRRNAVLKGIGATVAGRSSITAEYTADELVIRPIVQPQLQRPLTLRARKEIDQRLLSLVRQVSLQIFDQRK